MAVKRKRGGSPAVCAQCYQLIDLDHVQQQMRRGQEVRHDCGRLLYRKEK